MAQQRQRLPKPLTYPYEIIEVLAEVTLVETELYIQTIQIQHRNYKVLGARIAFVQRTVVLSAVGTMPKSDYIVLMVFTPSVCLKIVDAFSGQLERSKQDVYEYIEKLCEEENNVPYGTGH